MENASKALIIAGAILLSILIIAIGMYIYNSSQSSIMDAAGSLSSQEIEAFNATWDSYEGKQPGTNVKTLIGKMISNANTYEEEGSKLPDLVYWANSSSTQEDVVSEAGGTNVSDFNTAKTAIEAKHTYFVEIEYSEETSLVDRIIVKYDEDDEVTE